MYTNFGYVFLNTTLESIFSFSLSLILYFPVLAVWMFAMAEAGRSVCLSCLTLTFCPFRLSSVFKLCPKTQQWFEGYMIHHYENAINSLQEMTCLSLSRSLFSFFISNYKDFTHFSTFSMFSPLALHIWHSVSWTAATLNASGSTPHGTEILAKYFPPLTGRAHLCGYFWHAFAGQAENIFNLCYFY